MKDIIQQADQRKERKSFTFYYNPVHSFHINKNLL